MKKQFAWAISGVFPHNDKPFIYYGTWVSRAEAIGNHERMIGRSWMECKKHGDRAIKVEVVPLTKLDTQVKK